MPMYSFHQNLEILRVRRQIAEIGFFNIVCGHNQPMVYNTDIRKPLIAHLLIELNH
jgi:hypothetical protein